MFMFEFSINEKPKQFRCSYCWHPMEIQQSQTDYQYFVCKKCLKYHFTLPIDKRYMNDNAFDDRIKLDEIELNELINIALDFKDKEWFERLVRMKNNIVDGWSVTEVREGYQL